MLASDVGLGGSRRRSDYGASDKTMVREVCVGVRLDPCKHQGAAVNWIGLRGRAGGPGPTSSAHLTREDEDG